MTPDEGAEDEWVSNLEWELGYSSGYERGEQVERDRILGIARDYLPAAEYDELEARVRRG